MTSLRRPVFHALLGGLLSAGLTGPVLPAQETPLVAGSEGVPVPKRTKMVKPDYPAEAQAQGIRGIVILDLTIDTEGKVAAVEVIRSIPGLDDAAISAVKKWEYEPVKVGGRAIAVKLTVPITFLMHLPEITRQEGIPELRQGAVPVFPRGMEGRGTASALAELTVDSDGRVVEAEIRDGDPPYAEALLQAVRSWNFAPGPGRGTISFRVQADFLGAERGQPRVTLALSGLRESHRLATPAPAEPRPDPAPGASESEAKPAAASPQPTDAADAAPTPPAAAAASPAPPATAPDARPEPAASAAPEPAPITPPAPQPPTEILRPPMQPAPAPDTPALSAVRDVVLGIGMPELTKGRRPVAPPLARMAGVTGRVEVRFAIDAAGGTSVQATDGPDLLRPAAESAVASWVFRRTSTERLRAVAEFSYTENGASATARLEP